jgi:hypothetical protein
MVRHCAFKSSSRPKLLQHSLQQLCKSTLLSLISSWDCCLSGIDTEESPSLAAAQEIRGKGKTGTDVKSSKESKGPEEDSPEVEKARRKQRRAAAGRAHGKFRNVHSDALSVVNALWSYEKSVDQESFCETNYLHAKTMQEMAKLRHQLSQLVIQYSMDAGAHFLELGQSGLTKEYLLEAEEAWQSMEQQKLNINQEMVVQQAICAGDAFGLSCYYQHWFYHSRSIALVTRGFLVCKCLVCLLG